jgi:hypothetical protein
LESNTVFVGFTATCGFRDRASRRERRRNGQRASAKNAFFLFTRKKDEKNRRVPETKHARTWFFAASPTSLSVSVKAT